MGKINNGKESCTNTDITEITDNDIANMTYEEAISELESILDRMDRGELPLADSMKNFERGMELITHCENILSSYESRITKILEDKNGGLKEVEIEL